MDDLFKLQKQLCTAQSFRIVYEARWFEYFQRLQWLPIDKICEIQKLCLFRKIIDDRAPEYLIHKLEPFRFNHKYHARL